MSTYAIAIRHSSFVFRPVSPSFVFVFVIRAKGAAPMKSNSTSSLSSRSGRCWSRCGVDAWIDGAIRGARRHRWRRLRMGAGVRREAAGVDRRDLCGTGAQHAVHRATVLRVFGLPAAGVKAVTPEIASIIAMVVNLGAYATEIVRAGLDATPRGQYDAAKASVSIACRCSASWCCRPRSPKVWPAMVSQIIIVMLGSAVCGQISTEELSYAANLIQSRNFRAFESFIIAGAIYLLLAISVRRVLTWVGPLFSGASAKAGAR